MPKKNFIPQKERAWIEARNKFHLSHAQIQMARKLGMIPSSRSKLANCQGKPWKIPLPEFIENLYFKRFGKQQPEIVISIEQRVKAKRAKKAAKRQDISRPPPSGPSEPTTESGDQDQKSPSS